MLNDWDDMFNKIKRKEYYHNLTIFLNEQYSQNVVYPSYDLIFNAFKLTNPKNIKVIIIGQDPYHEPNQAMGLAFSVPQGINLPPSLINIFKEIENEYSIKMNRNGDLTYLANQGVLLINTILSVVKNKPLSHNIDEYNLLMIDILEYIDTLPQPIVFLLWGGHAKKYIKYINSTNRLILTSVHPSPLSANRGGWFGNNHFKDTNAYLSKHGVKPINWVN